MKRNIKKLSKLFTLGISFVILAGIILILLVSNDESAQPKEDTINTCGLKSEYDSYKEQIEDVAYEFYCNQLNSKGAFDLVEGDETNILPTIGYDTTNLEYGNLTIRDVSSGETLYKWDFNRRTLLRVMYDSQLFNKYHFFMLNTPTGMTCELPTSDENYEFLCGNLEKDFDEFGGIWVFDIEEKELQRLVNFQNNILE